MFCTREVWSTFCVAATLECEVEPRVARTASARALAGTISRGHQRRTRHVALAIALASGRCTTFPAAHPTPRRKQLRTLGPIRKGLSFYAKPTPPLNELPVTSAARLRHRRPQSPRGSESVYPSHAPSECLAARHRRDLRSKPR